MTYLNLIVFFSQLSINESSTLCLQIFKELRMKKNQEWYWDRGGEEDERWNTIMIVTMATVNIYMVAMDSSVIILLVLFHAAVGPN